MDAATGAEVRETIVAADAPAWRETPLWMPRSKAMGNSQASERRESPAEMRLLARRRLLRFHKSRSVASCPACAMIQAAAYLRACAKMRPLGEAEVTPSPHYLGGGPLDGVRAQGFRVLYQPVSRAAFSKALAGRVWMGGGRRAIDALATLARTRARRRVALRCPPRPGTVRLH